MCRRVERRDAEMQAAWAAYKAHRSPEAMHRYEVSLRLRSRAGEVLQELLEGRRLR